MFLIWSVVFLIFSLAWMIWKLKKNRSWIVLQFCEQNIYLTLDKLLFLEQMLLRSIMNQKQKNLEALDKSYCKLNSNWLCRKTYQVPICSVWIADLTWRINKSWYFLLRFGEVFDHHLGKMKCDFWKYSSICQRMVRQCLTA